MRGMKRKVIFVAGALVAIAAVAWGANKANTLYQALYVRLPEYPAVKKTVWLDQNVSKKQLGWFYHADQGTRTFGIPYEWFVALEQPEVSLRILPTVGSRRSGRSAIRTISIAMASSAIRWRPTARRFRSALRAAVRCCWTAVSPG